MEPASLGFIDDYYPFVRESSPACPARLHRSSPSTAAAAASSAQHAVRLTVVPRADTSPLLHTVTLKGLAADTKHYYRAGCDNGTGVWSDVYSFTTPPAAPSGRITLGLLGDHGHTNNSQATLQRMMAASPAYDVIVHAGDISCASLAQRSATPCCLAALLLLLLTALLLLRRCRTRCQWMATDVGRVHELDPATGQRHALDDDSRKP